MQATCSRGTCGRCSKGGLAQHKRYRWTSTAQHKRYRWTSTVLLLPLCFVPLQASFPAAGSDTASTRPKPIVKPPAPHVNYHRATSITHTAKRRRRSRDESAHAPPAPLRCSMRHTPTALHPADPLRRGSTGPRARAGSPERRGLPSISDCASMGSAGDQKPCLRRHFGCVVADR